MTYKYNECESHYLLWTEDNDTRLTRKNGWNDITDAYWGKLPESWPFSSRVVDPRIRTVINEKNARILNSKLRGRIVPREGGDVVKARLNNAKLDYDWDVANYGGSMLQKWSQMDQETRLYASKFALVPWMVRKNSEGGVEFEGNEFQPLDIRDVGIDPNAKNVRNANWVQVRNYTKIEDLENANKNKLGVDVYPGLKDLKKVISKGTQDRRDNNYSSRIKQLKGLDDRMGEDSSFPVIEVVTEYRPDRWITFCPKHKVILRDIPNPYNHGKIPIVQLCYYPLGDDPIGESEVEPVLGIWRAIQVVLNGFLDTLKNRIRPPLKVIEGAVRMETIEYGPDAQWIMTRPDGVMETQGNGEALQYFQTSYSALTSAFTAAMNAMSQGVSQTDQFNPDKTATEVKASVKQQTVMDQKNQNDLAEAIADMMSMWLSNNRQFLFTDPSKQEFLLKILGNENFSYFKRLGMDQEEVPGEALKMIEEIIIGAGGNMSDLDLQDMYQNSKLPKYPIIENPKEKDFSKMKIKPKMKVNDMGDGADLYLTRDDFDGSFDYIADVKSMATGADVQTIEALNKNFEIMTNPNVVQLLTQEGWKPKLKELIVDLFNYNGSTQDSEKYFEQISGQGTNIPANTTGNIPGQPGQGGSPAIPQVQGEEQMGGSNVGPQQQGIPQTI